MDEISKNSRLISLMMNDFREDINKQLNEGTKTQWKASAINWIKQRKEYQNLKIRPMDYHIQAALKEKRNY